MSRFASSSEFASIAEVCVRFGVSDATIRRLIRAGKLESIKIGSQIRIPQRSVEKLGGEK